MLSDGITHTIVAISSADIGKGRGSKDQKLVSTVAGIIDGCGNVGSAIGQYVVGRLETAYGWRYGYCLNVAIMYSLTILPVSIILHDEIKDIKRIRSEKKKIAEIAEKAEQEWSETQD